jgi:hypothetical protein
MFIIFGILTTFNIHIYFLDIIFIFQFLISISFVIYSVRFFNKISKLNPLSYDLINEKFKLKVRENYEEIKFF